MDYISNEILQHIFSFITDIEDVSNVLSVCRRFNINMKQAVTILTGSRKITNVNFLTIFPRLKQVICPVEAYYDNVQALTRLRLNRLSLISHIHTIGKDWVDLFLYNNPQLHDYIIEDYDHDHSQHYIYSLGNKVKPFYTYPTIDKCARLRIKERHTCLDLNDIEGINLADIFTILVEHIQINKLIISMSTAHLIVPIIAKFKREFHIILENFACYERRVNERIDNIKYIGCVIEDVEYIRFLIYFLSSFTNFTLVDCTLKIRNDYKMDDMIRVYRDQIRRLYYTRWIMGRDIVKLREKMAMLESMILDKSRIKLFSNSQHAFLIKDPEMVSEDYYHVMDNYYLVPEKSLVQNMEILVKFRIV